MFEKKKEFNVLNQYECFNYVTSILLQAESAVRFLTSDDRSTKHLEVELMVSITFELL